MLCRVVGNDHRDWQFEGGNFKQQNFSKETNNNSLLQMEEEAAPANVFEHHQVSFILMMQTFQTKRIIIAFHNFKIW